MVIEAALDGLKVRELREARGWSPRILAAFASDFYGKTISWQAVEQLEAGDYSPGLPRSIAIARALGVGIEEILTPMPDSARVGA